VFEASYYVEVVTPEEFLGDVTGDLIRRGARIEGQESRGDMLALSATVAPSG
jgi:elongation factor G